MGDKIVFAVIALIVLFIIFMRVRLDLIFKNGSAIKLRISFITLTIFDDRRKKRPKKRKYTKKALEKRQKKAKKSLKKKEKKEASKSVKNVENMEKRKFSFPDDAEALLSLLSSFFGDFLLPIVRRARVRFKYFKLTVASSDPADTAILYGVLSQGVAYLLNIISNNAKISERQLKKVSLDCDFLEEKTSLEIYVTVSFSIWKLIILIAHGGFKFFEKWTNYKNSKGTTTDKKAGHKVQ